MKHRQLTVLIALVLPLSFPALFLAGPPGEEKPDAKEKSAKAAKPAEKKSPAGKKAEGPDENAPAEKVRTVAEIEKDMKKAVLARNYGGLWTLSLEAVDLKEPAAYKAVITYALRGEDRDLEVNVFRLFLKLEDPALLDTVCQEALKSTNFKTRIILLGIANQKRTDPKAFSVLVEALKDHNPVVVRTAVEDLRKAKDPDRAVPALIEVLKTAERGSRGRLFYDVESALQDLTGADLELAADWKNFWDNIKAGGNKPPKKSEMKTQVRLAPQQIFTLTLNSDKVVFLIDISGSMEKRDPPMPEEEKKAPAPAPSGRTVVRKDPKTEAREARDQAEKKKQNAEAGPERERLFRVKQELTRLIRGLPQNVNFTVGSFNHEVAFMNEPPRLMPATPDNKRRAEDWVKAMKANGETWTDTIMQRALTEIPDVDTIFLLSDGCPYRNGANIPPDQVRDGIKVLNRFVKARINTIGFAQEGANLQRFLKAVAAEHEGKYTALR